GPAGDRSARRGSAARRRRRRGGGPSRARARVLRAGPLVGGRRRPRPRARARGPAHAGAPAGGPLRDAPHARHTRPGARRPRDRRHDARRGARTRGALAGARLQVARGDLVAARAEAEAALATFEQLGPPHWAERARRRVVELNTLAREQTA